MLTHLALSAGRFAEAPAFIAELPGTVAIECTDASTAVMVAAHADEWDGPIGLWLNVSDAYPAALAARDVATVAQLCALDVVVIDSGDAHSNAHADVVRALLEDGPVTFTNEVATLVEAYNRPIPPRPIRVFAGHAYDVADGDATWRRQSIDLLDDGLVECFVP